MQKNKKKKKKHPHTSKHKKKKKQPKKKKKPQIKTSEKGGILINTDENPITTGILVCPKKLSCFY